MNKKLFERYAAIKMQISALEEEMEVLQPDLLAEMPEDTPVELENIGTFSIGKRKKWTFPKEVEVVRQKLKEEEKLSQQTGTATYEENKFITFKVMK